MLFLLLLACPKPAPPTADAAPWTVANASWLQLPNTTVMQFLLVNPAEGADVVDPTVRIEGTVDGGGTWVETVVVEGTLKRGEQDVPCTEESGRIVLCSASQDPLKEDGLELDQLQPLMQVNVDPVY
jgi:hypothetical protein